MCMMRPIVVAACLVGAAAIDAASRSLGDEVVNPVLEAARTLAKMKVRLADCPQSGVSFYRNNVSGASLPTDWDIQTGRNVKWSARLGSQTYSSPVIANGKVFVGTNNGGGYLKRFPPQIDLSVLLCFSEADGRFLWQHSNEKLRTGRIHDWEQLGLCSCPYVEGNRLWYVTNRNEIACLDTEGFLDGENDGPFTREPNQNRDEADIIWKVDLMERFGALPHNQARCAVTAAGDTLFVSTSNGIDEAHKALAKPDAPSFLALNKHTGEVLWTDNSPGANILHGQWSSPCFGVLGGVAQVIFAGGDGWLYSFDPQGESGKSKLLWKFDCNPKESVYKLQRATRNPIIATPVIYDGFVYMGVGEDPEHGRGNGHLWCIDPTKRGDVSPTLVFNKADPETPILHRRIRACEPDKGDFERPNANSALVWHYGGADPKTFEQTMHRTLSSVAIKNDLLFVSDLNGLVHCLDAKTGKPHWTHDTFAGSWSSPLIAGECVYMANQDGDIFIFSLSKEKELFSREELNMGASISSTPVAANGVLFIATYNTLHAISGSALLEPDPQSDDAQDDEN